MAATDADFYRPRAAATEVSTAELEHRAALTNAIAGNLRAIAGDGTDWEALERRLESIVAALKLTREFSESLNLEQLEIRIASIASALRIIADDPTVRELEIKR
jgi:hypothetical protein